MGIFDPSAANPADRPIDLVGRYQSQMRRAAYSPSVAQAAARSGVNPITATRVAAREVGQEMSGALPGLLTQEAQMMEARRLENENKERQLAGMILNVAGSVGGTVMDAYAPGTGDVARGGMGVAGNALSGRGQAAQIRPVTAGGYAGGAVGGAAAAEQQALVSAPQAQPVSYQQFAQAPAATPSVVQQPLVDQPINYAQEIPEVWQATAGAPSNPADELLNTLPNQRNIRRRQPRQRRNG